MEKIESFQVNHLNLFPGLYVSRTDSYKGGEVTTFDMRFIAPNREPVMDMSAIHTIEHLAATFLRNSNEKDKVLYFGPMGCRTGFYLVLFGRLESRQIYDLIVDTCKFIIDFEGEIPGAKPSECGNYLEHNLATAKYYTKRYLSDLQKYKRFTYPI